MKDGFIRCAVCSPALKVADTAYNAEQIVREMHAHADAQLVVFPELCLTGYTCGDLFGQETLLRGAEDALRTVADAGAELNQVTVVGLPLAVGDKLCNTAAVLCGGKVLGIVPKTMLPNYGEFYEMRHFVPGPAGVHTVRAAGETVPFGTDLLFRCGEMPSFRMGVELCEDLWAPVPPSCRHALNGATVLVNLSASDETTGKAEYRRSLVTGQSARLLSAYLYASAGYGESTQDMSFSGHDLIAENGTLLAESVPFGQGCAVTEIDTARMEGERRRNTTFRSRDDGYTVVPFSLKVTENALTRFIDPAPFVPADPEKRNERCETILNIQAEGLRKRLDHVRAKTAVIGISGGLDSCLALLVAVRAFRRAGRSLTGIEAVTMPCYGTTRRTRTNAERLCRALGTSFREIDITRTVESHLADLCHRKEDTDVTFENAQARVRTLELMALANQTGGIVVGTGDLSELALGWATYNGDHMSMYGVNAGVPKTLVRHLVRWEADRADSEELRACLLDILDTPVSPELLPAQDGEIVQKTEDIIGPYELHDFYLYNVLRFGFPPAKIARLSEAAFRGRYRREELLYWEKNFYRRFFAQQFKRSCLPDGPKIGSVSLSPRGDWRMPSDAEAALWLRELDALS